MYELPLESIRELIANAVVHRSYLEPSKVQVALYDDRLEITSPGMLIGGLSIEDLKAGCCQARNRGIVSAFTYMKIIEQWGSGIPRLMENCKSAGLREPELLEIGGSFRVNMFRNTEILSETTQTTQGTIQTTQAIQDTTQTIQDEILTDLDKEVLKLLLKKPEITQKEMALELGWKVERVKYYTNKLKKQNVIERVGSSQKGYWKVHE